MMKKYNEYITESKAKEHPILISARKGSNTAVKKYIKSGVINIQDKSGRTPLMLSVYGNYLMVVKTLIDAGVDVNICDEDGRSALCRVHTIKILDMLLNAGADVNSKDKDGLIPIMETIYHHRRSNTEVIMNFLKKHIEHGLDLDIKTNNDLNVYEQIRKWIVENSLIQKYMDENYPQYKEEYEIKQNVDKYNL